MIKELDYFEGYSTKALIRAAYVSSATPTYSGTDAMDSLSSINASASTYPISTVYDNAGGAGNGWYTPGYPTNQWLWMYWAAGKVIGRIYVWNGRGDSAAWCVRYAKLEGSMDGSNWTKVPAVAWAGGASAYNTDEFELPFNNSGYAGLVTFDNDTAYKYYRLYCYNTWGSTSGVQIQDLTMYEKINDGGLQCWPESSLQFRGSYALKAIALATTGLNQTLTRTIGSPIDLSGVSILKFWIRASRTGSNIKIGIRDSGGTTTEITPNVAQADTWQEVTWDISGVTNANKDAIDRIIITIVNADAQNTFYLDQFYARKNQQAIIF